jgi:hypothetical protein
LPQEDGRSGRRAGHGGEVEEAVFKVFILLKNQAFLVFKRSIPTLLQHTKSKQTLKNAQDFFETSITAANALFKVLKKQSVNKH